jgi:hypothetical protein
LAQQVISTGTGPNTGTGDPGFTAFTKVNANFTELYLGSPPPPTITGPLTIGPPASGVALTVNGVVNQSTVVFHSAGASGAADFSFVGPIVNPLALSLRNTDTGATSASVLSVVNSAHAAVLEITSTGFVGTVVPGGPTGEQCVIGNFGATPLTLFTNNAPFLTATSAGSVSIYTPTSNAIALGINCAAPSVANDRGVAIANSAGGGDARLGIQTTTSGNAQIDFDTFGSANWVIGNARSDGSFRISTSQTLGSFDRLTISNPGNVTINAPASGNTLVLTQTAGGIGMVITGAGTASSLIITNTVTNGTALSSGDTSGGTNQTVARLGPIIVSVGEIISSGYSEIISAGSNPFYVGTNSTQALVLCTVSVGRMSINGTGNFNISAPTSGTTVTLASASGALCMQMNGSGGGAYTNASGSTGNQMAVWDSSNAAGGYLQLTASSVATNYFGSAKALISGSLSVNDAAVRATGGIILGVNGGTPAISLSAAGAFSFSGGIGSTQVTGWGTPTGFNQIINFPGASATLVQCSQVIGRIIADLKNFGFYAA